MRILLPLAASLLFSGCPPKTPSTSSPSPTPPQPTPAASTVAGEPSPTPSMTVEAQSPTPSTTPEVQASTPSTTQEPQSPTPSVSPEAEAAGQAFTPEDPTLSITPEAEQAIDILPAAPKPKISYEGIWTTRDAQGQLFDIIVFPNGQAVTNWTKGTEGARGERGYWRQDEQRLTVLYSDGSTDILEQDESEVRHRRYSPGSPLDAQPVARGDAKRADSNQSPLIGVWQLNKEPDGSHLYIALQSNGRAISTINGGTEGKWKTNEKGALCEWPDGWVDQIERGISGWQKRSWVGSETSAPADLSLATRVGEARFSVAP